MGMMRTVGLGLMFAGLAEARCAMCWLTAQSLGAARGHVLNTGIVIMVVPSLVILVGSVLFVRRLDRGGKS
jgi:hypothetical protein